MISVDTDFQKYDLIIAPVLYMVKPGTAEKLDINFLHPDPEQITQLTRISSDCDQIVFIYNAAEKGHDFCGYRFPKI
jgi:beta-galactosidase GanA